MEKSADPAFAHANPKQWGLGSRTTLTALPELHHQAHPNTRIHYLQSETMADFFPQPIPARLRSSVGTMTIIGLHEGRCSRDNALGIWHPVIHKPLGNRHPFRHTWFKTDQLRLFTIGSHPTRVPIELLS